MTALYTYEGGACQGKNQVRSLEKCPLWAVLFFPDSLVFLFPIFPQVAHSPFQTPERMVRQPRPLWFRPAFVISLPADIIG